MSPDEPIRDFQRPESLPHFLRSGATKVYPYWTNAGHYTEECIDAALNYTLHYYYKKKKKVTNI